MRQAVAPLCGTHLTQSSTSESWKGGTYEHSVRIRKEVVNSYSGVTVKVVCKAHSQRPNATLIKDGAVVKHIKPITHGDTQSIILRYVRSHGENVNEQTLPLFFRKPALQRRLVQGLYLYEHK